MILVFSKKVYNLLEQVPVGRVTTYKALAQAMNTVAYQAIGQVLKRNPNAPSIPCHRVVAADGSIGGFTGHRRGKMVDKKIDLLKSEGVKLVNQIVNFGAENHDDLADAFTLLTLQVMKLAETDSKPNSIKGNQFKIHVIGSPYDTPKWRKLEDMEF